MLLLFLQYVNVRLMYETGETVQGGAEMRRFNLAVLWICETIYGLSQDNCD